MFEQFKENFSLAKETAKTAREGFRSGQSVWRNAPAARRVVWLLVPSALAVSAVAERFSVPWYYEAAIMLALVVGWWILGAIRRKLQ